MSWRTVVITKQAKLELRLNHMVIRQVDHTSQIYIDEIAVLLIESTAVSLTAALLSQLVEKKVKVIFCNAERNPVSELVPLYGAHDSSSKIKRQIGWKEETKVFVWTEIVRAKIAKQRELLKKAQLSEEALKLEGYLEELELGDATNREGHAAKVYFNGLFGMGFIRGEDSPINAALNYGYSILLSCFNREVSANGYLTQLGLFHDNMFNHFNLSSDLMEPYRFLVDRKVHAMNPKIFAADEKRELLSLLNDEVLIDWKKATVLNAIKIYCHSIFDALDQDDLSCIRMYGNEL